MKKTYYFIYIFLIILMLSNVTQLFSYDNTTPVKDGEYIMEGFEDATFPPFGWENPGDHWNRFTTETYEGEGYARCSWYHNADAILISPRLIIEGADSISFFWRNDNLYDSKGTDIITGDTLFIEISNSYLDPVPDWECIGTLSATTPMTTYEEVSFTISDTYIGNDAKIRWRHHSEVNNESRGVGLDNITMPVPYIPLNFTVEPSFISDYIGPDNYLDFQYEITNNGVQFDRYFLTIEYYHIHHYNPVEPEVFYNFDIDDGGWVATADWDPVGDWAWTNAYDVNNYTGANNPPLTAHSGTGLWATVPNGDYTNSGGYSYVSKTADFEDVNEAYMAFWYWSDIYGAWDYCDVSVNGDILLTIDSYPGTEWEYVELDLSAYDGLSDVEIVFVFYATAIVSRAGLYIDDVEISAPNIPSPGNNWPITLSEYDIYLDPGETGSFTLHVFLPAYTELDHAQLTPVMIKSREDSTLKQQVLSLATCHPRDPYEPNDKMIDATPANYSFSADETQIYYDPYYRNKDIDIYQIACLEGDIVSCSFELPPDETEFDGAIKLVNADSTELAYADAFAGGGSEYLQYRILEDGIYYWILGKWNEVLEETASKKTQIRGENTTYYTVTFDHIPSPEIEITPTSLTLGIIAGTSGSVSDELYISNTATNPQAENLDWNIEIQNMDSLIILTTSPDSGSVTPGQTDMVIVTCVVDSLLPAGTYTADLIVHNNVLPNGASDIIVPVTLYYADESGGLEGYVSYGGNPLVGVHIIVGNFETYTDENGYFSFDAFSIPGGFYTVYVYYEDELLVPPIEVYLNPGWLVLLCIDIPVSLPPPENFTATPDEYGCIYLEWDPPQSGGGSTQVDYILDDGSYENSWAVDPGNDCWFGNLFPTMDSGEIVCFEVYGDENVSAGDMNVWIDVFDSDMNYVGSSNSFVIPANDWITVQAPHIPFSGDFYAMIHWDDLPTSTNYVGFDENGPWSNSNCDRYYDGANWQLFHDAASCNPGVFAIRTTALLPDQKTQVTYTMNQSSKKPEVHEQFLNTPSSHNIFSEGGRTSKAGKYNVSYITLTGEPGRNSKDLPDPTLFGYTLCRNDIGMMYYFDSPSAGSYTDCMVSYGVEYTYTLYAMYDLGSSPPVTDTATAGYQPGIGYHETFEEDWATTGWTTLGSPNNWLWSADYAYLSWSPTVTNYDMSLISPMIELPNDPLDIFDLTVSMYIDDYSSDSGEIMEIWVLHDTGEDMIFEWDLDENDDWGSSGGADWIYEDISQYAGQTIQFKFRSHGGSTYNINYWYIYDVLLEYAGIIPDYGALEGTVTDYDGNPIQNVQISIAGGTVYTDENGHYLASPVEVGIYDIPFYHEDYTIQWFYDVEIDEGDTTLLDAVLGNPTMEISPDSLYVELPPYCSTSRTLTITNNGTIDLDWHISYWDKTAHRYEPDKSKIRSNSFSIYSESGPDAVIHTPPSSDEIWDIMFSYDVDTPTGGVGIAGAEFGNSYFLVSEWGSSTRNVFKFDVDGNYISSWEPSWIQGTGGIRDMAFDGEYFYGSNAGTNIYQFDENGNLIGTIPSPVAVRAIAYDEINDAFWVNNWDADLKLIDRSGSVLNTIASPPSMYGCAYDNVSIDGPFLWIFTGTSTGGGCQIEQYDLNTLSLTGVTHSVSGDFGAYIAGGLFASGDIVPGTRVLGGLAQGTPDILFGYELCPYQYSPHVVFNPLWGTVSPNGGTQDVTVTFNSYGLSPGTIISGDVFFRSHQNVPPVPIPISLMIINPEYGALMGTISHGYPIENAEVHAYNGSYGYTTYTNSSGFYIIEDMAVGNYTVEITRDGYNTYTTPDVPILAEQVTTLNVTLTAPVMVVDPQFIPVGIPYGVTDTTKYFTIFNEGDGPLDFNIEVYDVTKNKTDYSRFICDDKLISLKSESIAGTSSFRATNNRDDTIIQYQNGYNNNGIGTGGPFSALAAARFTSDELLPYYNTYSLTQVNIHIRSADFSLVELKVWEGGSYGDPGTGVYSQDITDDIVVDAWTTITLSTPIPLVYGNEYWIGYAIDATGDHPCSVDAGPAVDGKGDWIYYNGEWSLLTDLSPGLDYNWCIQGVLCTGYTYWINIDPISGTIPAYSQMEIEIMLDATGLVYGVIYEADIDISSTPNVGADTVKVLLALVDTVSTQNSIIKETSLHNNFPNPVINNTTFEFSLKEKSHVILSVYNLKGQLVATLLDEELDPSASHCVEWDGTANGKKLANGIYFYKLETDKKSFLKKMVLMR